MHWTLSTALDANAVPPSMHCASSVGSTDVMVLGSYKFILIFDIKHVTLSIQTLPCFCFIVFIILLLIGNHTSHHRPLPHLTKLHLGSTIPPSCIPSTLSQPQLASSPVQTHSCLFYPDDAAECCDALADFLKWRRSSLGLESVTAGDIVDSDDVAPIVGVTERVTGMRSRARTSVSSTSPYINNLNSRQSTIRGE